MPFCARACPYCDFDFEVLRQTEIEMETGALAPRVSAWLEGLEAERDERWAGELAGRRVDTLYLGGGTPSAVGVAGLERLFAWVESRFELRLAALDEVTVELNPEHLDAALLACLVDAGVSRVSLGVQSLAASGLRELGRVHAREQALACVRRAHGAGLGTSADLMLGWRGQTPAGLRREIDALLEAGADHLSIYALTIEEDTPWPGLVARGQRELPDDDVQAELLQVAEGHLAARGFRHYEVASYAAPGAAEAIHNGKYWRWRDVVALGPSAVSVRHGLVEGRGVVARRMNPRGLERWLSGAAPERERLEGEGAAAEGLWLGLRRLEGVDVAAFSRRFGLPRSWVEARVARQVGLGNLEWVGDPPAARLRVAPGRWLVHDTIAVDLL